ncbi:MAG: type II toxin-antitoxin system HicB family antitoxin [Chloroflexi bacterium]|nr:type II toxin-antitoxin system HicB family antitoxin [Chloroflexota bacterium]
MTYLTTVIVEDQFENEYYIGVPELEGSQPHDDYLDEVLPDIWEAVALYLETISEESYGYAVY